MAIQHWRKTISKLRSMDRGELFDRGRQEIGKRSDVLLATCGYDFARNKLHSSAGQPARFFFRPEDIEQLLILMRQRIPEQVEDIVARANRICSHRFDLLGYEDLNYGGNINWHLDLVHGKTAPRKPFHRIRYLDFDEVGDSKITWELNRHQHVVTLAKAYRLTGDECFANEIFAQWRSWHEQNPYPVGINWASSLEVAFRSLSWIWVHALLEGTRFHTSDFKREYLRAQAVNGRHIGRYLSTYFSPNTHLLGEGIALFFLGVLCPDLLASDHWKSRGWQIVLEESERQVNPDGFHFEQSTYYHVYALDLFLHAVLLASVNGLTVPSSLEKKLQQMLDALFLLGKTGNPPRFGDDDGGRLFDAVRNRDENLLDPLSTGAILFSRGDFKALARELREETIWLVGAAGVAEWDRLESKPVNLHSAALPDSGIFAAAANATSSQLIVKGGASLPQSRGHSHADALSVCVQSSGRVLLIDPGTCDYLGERPERNLYRGTSLHNTVAIDGLDQAEADGPFSWKQDIEVHTEQWIRGERFTYFEGVLRGYSHLPQKIEHHRAIVSLHSGIFLVRDVIHGEGEHRLELFWRLAPDLQLVEEHLFRAKKSSQGLALLPVQNHGWSEEVHKGPWSPVYGAQRTTTVLKFGRRTNLPAQFATLLIPLREVSEIPGGVSRVQQGTDFVHAYRYETAEMNYEFFFADEAKPWKCGRVGSDACFVCLLTSRLQAQDRETLPSPNEAVLCNGSYVEVDGIRTLAASRRVQYCEWLNNSGEQRLFSSDPDAVTHPAVLDVAKQDVANK